MYVQCTYQSYCSEFLLLKFENIIKLQIGEVILNVSKIAFFLKVAVTCFYLTQTYNTRTKNKEVKSSFRKSAYEPGGPSCRSLSW